MGTIARPLLVSPAGAIGGEVLKGIVKTYFGEKATKKEEQKDIDMPRNNNLIWRFPRRVLLPNGRVFFTK